jgi:hypothetical protein
MIQGRSITPGQVGVVGRVQPLEAASQPSSNLKTAFQKVFGHLKTDAQKTAAVTVADLEKILGK